MQMKTKFFSKSEVEAAYAEHRAHPGSLITKVMNYNDSDILPIRDNPKMAADGKIKRGKHHGYRVAQGAVKHCVGYVVTYAESLLIARPAKKVTPLTEWNTKYTRREIKADERSYV